MHSGLGIFTVRTLSRVRVFRVLFSDNAKWGGYWSVDAAKAAANPASIPEDFGIICAGCGQNILGKGKDLGKFTFSV